MKSFEKHIAPAALIRKDFDVLRKTERLATTNEIQDLLFVQSIEGRAHNGHGVFSHRPYVNTTIDDVVRALNRDPERTRRLRQNLIDDIRVFVESVINGEKRERLVNANGDPLLAIPFLKDRKVNGRDVVRGIYLGGLRDNVDIRKETERRYQINVGCGECYLVNVYLMTEMGLDGESLAHEPHEHEINEFMQKGLIVRSVPEFDDISNYRYFYVRHRVGPGQSDDCAIIMAGILYNVDVALGVFLADAIDTLEKYSMEYKDQDQELAFYIGRGFQDLQISIDDVYELAYLSTVSESEEDLIADSSLRYLLEIDPKYNISAIEAHLNFVEAKPITSMPVSHKRVMTADFYKYVKRRLGNVRRLDSLLVPEMQLKELNEPVRWLAQKSFIVVDGDEKLPEVVRKFKESKCEIIIIREKDGTILGTLTATDLIYFAG